MSASRCPLGGAAGVSALSYIIPYQKVVDGVNLAECITLAKLRQECKRFDVWVACLEKLGQEAVE